MATNLNLNRRGAPGSGSQAFDVLQKMIHPVSCLLVAAILSGCAISSLDQSDDAGPRETTQAFMTEVFQYDRDLFTDSSFKKRYFSIRLRDQIDEGLRTAVSYTPPPNEPWVGHPARQDRFNQTILNAWDVPTSFSVGEAEALGDTADVSVTYYWGPGTQYEGDERLTIVKLVRENSHWRVDDLVTTKGEFVPAGSLSETLKN